MNLHETVSFLKSKGIHPSKVGIVLGSGLGRAVEILENPVLIPYASIPHFQESTVSGHLGNLVYGTLCDIPTLILQGRLHYYEGHTIHQVVYPMRVLIELGVEIILLTNAAGGVNPAYRPLDFMILEDHINLMGVNPLIGSRFSDSPSFFVDCSTVYWKDGRRFVFEKAQSLGYRVHKGIYAAVTGPTFETPAEIRMMRIMGVDAVGMSTVPEALVAVQQGVKVIGISCITNTAVHKDVHEKTGHEEVLKASAHFSEYLKPLLTEAIPCMVHPSKKEELFD